MLARVELKNSLRKNLNLFCKKRRKKVFINGFHDKVGKENQKVGLIATLAVKTRRQVKKPASLVAEKRVKKELNILPADQHHQHAIQRVKEKSGERKNEINKITT